MTKLLFIVWDGPQVSYLDGLFFPIFKKIQEYKNIEFHIIQFSWGEQAKKTKLQLLAKDYGFHYTYQQVNRKPNPLPGALISVFLGAQFIKKYIKKNKIQIVMPRSTMPAIMINIANKGINANVIFDADGLPLEERVDFSGLKRSSFNYKILKFQETKILKRANAVVTRSTKSINIHLDTIGKHFHHKFFVVSNGRDPDFFTPSEEKRFLYRDQLGIKRDDLVFVYCGSLGPQYGLVEMLEIFSRYHSIEPRSKFLIITGSPSYLSGMIPLEIESQVLVKSLPFEKVPSYLNVADIAFAIRKPSYSMQGIAPIKLGEYMLLGLPCIASKGIGDTEPIIKNAPGSFLFDHDRDDNVEKVLQWILEGKYKSVEIRNFAITHFSLNTSAFDYLKAIDYVLNTKLKY
jgi:glycosyltransferase involved in cell wall biosynthesis